MDVHEVRTFWQTGFFGWAVGYPHHHRTWQDDLHRFPPPFQRPVASGLCLLTHSHGDHHNPRSLGKIRKPKTRAVAPKDLAGVATRVMAVEEEGDIDEYR